MKTSEINAWLKRGVEHQQKRELVAAERCYQTVLRDHPSNADATNLLGTLALEANKTETAVALFQKALVGHPSHPGYLSNLGSAYTLLQRYGEAARVFEKALKSQPGLADALLGLSQSYKSLNRGEEALALAERALKVAPRNPRAVVNLANLYVSAGEPERGVALLRPLVRRAEPVPAAIVAMSTAHRFEAADPEVTIIAAVADRADLSEGARADILHALGKVRADLGDHDGAFVAYQKAKSILGRSFDLARTTQCYSALIGGLDRRFFEARRDFGLPSAEPVFIVGMPRSGTTLTEQICSSHSQVTGVGEVPSMGSLANRFGWRRATPEQLIANLSTMTAPQSRELAQAYLDDLAQYGATGQHVIDKLPHNYEFLALIALLFPRARVIHCTRDPIDNCVSCFTHHFNENHGYNTNLAVLGQYYREYRRLMAHWRAVLPLRTLDFSYEALIADQEAKSRELIAFLGLDWEDACLDFHTNDRLVLTPSRWQVRQPIYKSSVKAWKKYEKHLGPLFEALGDLAVID